MLQFLCFIFLIHISFTEETTNLSDKITSSLHEAIQSYQKKYSNEAIKKYMDQFRMARKKTYFGVPYQQFHYPRTSYDHKINNNGEIDIIFDDFNKPESKYQKYITHTAQENIKPHDFLEDIAIAYRMKEDILNKNVGSENPEQVIGDDLKQNHLKRKADVGDILNLVHGLYEPEPVTAQDFEDVLNTETQNKSSEIGDIFKNELDRTNNLTDILLDILSKEVKPETKAIKHQNIFNNTDLKLYDLNLKSESENSPILIRPNINNKMLTQFKTFVNQPESNEQGTPIHQWISDEAKPKGNKIITSHIIKIGSSAKDKYHPPKFVIPINKDNTDTDDLKAMANEEFVSKLDSKADNFNKNPNDEIVSNLDSNINDNNTKSDENILSILNTQDNLIDQLLKIEDADKMALRTDDFLELMKEMYHKQSLDNTIPSTLRTTSRPKTSKLPPSTILTLIDETDIRNALKEDYYVKRVIKNAIKNKNRYLDQFA